MSNEIWMISNRQPWPEVLALGLITSKTRSFAVNLPPVGATVFLHASIVLWRDWKSLWWVKKHGIDMASIQRGGIVAVATVKANGRTSEVMPREDKKFFECEDFSGTWDCADEQTIVFENVQPIPFIRCKGSLVPTRKLPAELAAWLRKNPLDKFYGL